MVHYLLEAPWTASIDITTSLKIICSLSLQVICFISFLFSFQFSVTGAVRMVLPGIHLAVDDVHAAIPSINTKHKAVIF